MPVDTATFDEDPAHSTYPASRAFTAARQQGTDRGHRYLRRLREAYATEVRNVNRREEQVAIAETVGLDVDAFTTALDDAMADVHDFINTAVYRAGFADSQEEYETAVAGLFEALERWDDRLATQRYAAGDRLTLADVFLFPTLYRFESVYRIHLTCNERRLVEFDHLPAYARDVYQTAGVPPTCNTDHIKAHYYRRHEAINPTGIVPVGPDLDWAEPHDRDRLASGAESE